MNQLAGGQINTVVVREEGARRSLGPQPSKKQTERSTAAFLTWQMFLFLVLRSHRRTSQKSLRSFFIIMCFSSRDDAAAAGSSDEDESGLSYVAKF